MSEIFHIINEYRSCPQCKSAAFLEVRKHDPIWLDGEVWCSKCNVFVRYYDAG
jgi:hypothetical protein